jgi:Mor family transcriptional regulator
LKIEMLPKLWDIAEEITPDELPGRMQEVAKRLCIRDALLLMQGVPGLEIYIPSSIKIDAIKKYIIENYTGFNALSIAVKFGIDSSKVKEIARQKPAISTSYNSVQLQLVSERCGADLAQRLSWEFAGERVLIPTDKSFLQRKYIKMFFNGSNIPEITLQISGSDRFVRKVVKEMYDEGRSLQTNLFG